MKKYIRYIILLILIMFSLPLTASAEDAHINVNGYDIGTVGDNGYGSSNGKVNYIYGNLATGEGATVIGNIAMFCAEPGAPLPPSSTQCYVLRTIQDGPACHMADSLEVTGNYTAYAQNQLILWDYIRNGTYANDTCEHEYTCTPSNLADASISTTFASGNKEMTNNGSGWFVSSPITVSMNVVTSYSASLQNAPTGSKIVDSSGNTITGATSATPIRVMIPASAVTSALTPKINFTATASGTCEDRWNSLVIYNCGANQDLAIKGHDITRNPAGRTVTASMNLEIKSGAILITKVSSKDNSIKLANATFKLYKSDGVTAATYMDGSAIGELKTDSAGAISIGNLLAGTYVLKETKAPTGYIISTASTNITVSTGSTTNKTVTNTPVGSIVITKTDETDSKIVLKDVEFALYKSDGTTKATDASGKQVANVKTDASGKATFANLLYADYIVKEVAAPANYKIKVEATKVTVSKASNTVTITNTPLGKLKIVKVDSKTGQHLANTTFELYKCESTTTCNKPTKVTTDAYGTAIGAIVTDTNGEKTINNLYYGNYMLKETKNPLGYVILASTVPVAINKTAITELEIKNTPIEVQITKYDFHTKQSLAGATIVITDINSGEIYDEFITTTDTISIRMVPGEYILTEKIAPAGYQVLNESVKISVDADGNVKIVNITDEDSEKLIPGNNEIKIYDEKTKIKISKQDISNGKELPGATIKIMKSDGKIAKDAVTDEDIEFTSKDKATEFYLAPGEYKLQETKAPEGESEACLAKIEEYKKEGYEIKDSNCSYEVIDNVLNFKFTDEGNVELLGDDNEYYFLESNRVVVYNGNIPVPVPDTGAFTSITTILVGAALAYTGYVFIKKRKYA